MKPRILLLTTTSVLAFATAALASGYRIPEQSVNSTAQAGAYVASTAGPDASYFNPANMAWLENRWQMEADLTYIDLPSVTYTDRTTSANNGDSLNEEFLLPHLFVVSPDYGRFRFGFAVTNPAGLSKRWDDPFAQQSAKDFTLRVTEANPTVSYRINDYLAVAGGVRFIYASGEVRSFRSLGGGLVASRDLEGDTTEWGYNLAVTAKPTPAWTLAATYRSEIDLDLEGDAVLLAAVAPYSGYATVRVPVPAVLSLATSYTFGRTTVELDYDKTFWNAYNQLDFNYSQPLTGYLLGFDTPVAKNWVNAEAYRIGVSHQVNDQWTLMAGFAIDRTPVPDNTLGFELPDSDSKIYACGARYRWNDRLELGIAYLYNDKESRTVPAGSNATIDGTFSDGGARLLTLAARYTF